VVTARCRGTGRVPAPQWRAEERDAAGEPRGVRSVWFTNSEQQLETPVFDRDQLAVEQVVEGPALIEEWTTTLVVPPGWSASLARGGHITLTLEGRS
jgi:N-methylhydantoinase A